MQAERERIFGRIERGTAYDRAGATGFGLGLSIVRRMSQRSNILSLHSRVGRPVFLNSCTQQRRAGAVAPPAWPVTTASLPVSR
jgi:signal transduction histidine kinase